MLKWIFAMVLAAVLLIVGLSIYLQPNDFMSCGDRPVEGSSCAAADAVVVVSGGDTQARTAAGIRLYLNGWAEYLVLSGAALDKTGPSNAAAMKVQAERAGVPGYAILVDEEAMNTKENAENTHSIIAERHLDDIILVTSGYHQRRASLEFNKNADGTRIRNYPVMHDDDWSWHWWLTPRGWWLAGVEVAKIIAFYFGAHA